MAVITNEVRVARTQGVILGLLVVLVCTATGTDQSVQCRGVLARFQSKGFSITQLPDVPTNG